MKDKENNKKHEERRNESSWWMKIKEAEGRKKHQPRRRKKYITRERNWKAGCNRKEGKIKEGGPIKRRKIKEEEEQKIKENKRSDERGCSVKVREGTANDAGVTTLEIKPNGQKRGEKTDSMWTRTHNRQNIREYLKKYADHKTTFMPLVVSNPVFRVLAPQVSDSQSLGFS